MVVVHRYHPRERWWGSIRFAALLFIFFLVVMLENCPELVNHANGLPAGACSLEYQFFFVFSAAVANTSRSTVAKP